MEPEKAVVEEAALPSADVAQQQLDFELKVLRALPGVTSVTDFPTGGVTNIKPNVPQDNGVRLKLNGRKLDQRFNSKISDKITAARVLKERMKGADFVGEAAVLAAEAQVRLAVEAVPLSSSEALELTEVELQWLSDWYDSQSEPDQATLEQAAAALEAHRASSGGSSITQRLFEAQARVRAI